MGWMTRFLPFHRSAKVIRRLTRLSLAPRAGFEPAAYC
jgi:hypothetical protein